MISGVCGPGLMRVSVEITAKDAKNAKDSMATAGAKWAGSLAGLLAAGMPPSSLQGCTHGVSREAVRPLGLKPKTVQTIVWKYTRIFHDLGCGRFRTHRVLDGN